MYKAINDEVGARHVQIVTSLGDSCPRTDIIGEDRVCHHLTQILRVQGECTANTGREDTQKAAGQDKEPHLRDQKPLHIKIMGTTTEGSERQDQK